MKAGGLGLPTRTRPAPTSRGVVTGTELAPFLLVLAHVCHGRDHHHSRSLRLVTSVSSPVVFAGAAWRHLRTASDDFPRFARVTEEDRAMKLDNVEQMRGVSSTLHWAVRSTCISLRAGQR